MEISPIILIKLLIYSVIWGAIIGLGFNINKALRIFFDLDIEKSKSFFCEKLLNKKFYKKTDVKYFRYRKQAEWFIIFFQDFIIAVIFIIGLLFINFSLNKGVFRFFSFPASIIGLLVFKFTCGKPVLNILEWLCHKVKIWILFVFCLIYYPFIQIPTKICVFCKKNYIFLENSIAKQIKKRYNNYKKESLIKFAESAFLNVESFRKTE